MTVAERNSDLPQIAVNANNIPDDSVDCGIRQLGWCRGPACQKYARLRTFVLVLAFAGVLQGACESYFRVSAKQAALENGYNPLIVDWLLVSSGILQAVFALVFAHWAQKLHPINWLSGAIMLQAAICVIAVIPSIINFSDGVVVATHISQANLCRTSTFQMMQRAMLTALQSQLLTLILLFVLQFGLGLGSLAFYTVGITYVDDNSLSIDSPAVIATAFGARIFGLQFGSGVILGVGVTSFGWWLGWVILGPLVFVSGMLLGLFPKRLPKTMIHQAAQRIIEETRTRQFGSQFSTYIDDTAFGPSVKRLFGNKLLMFNLMSIMFIQAATLNYTLQEESYLQSRFFLAYNEEDGLTQEWKARFVSYFLKPPVAAVCMLLGGLIISKLKFSGRKIAGVNISLSVHLLAIYIAYIFIKCKVGPIAGVTGGKLLQPYCSRQCFCDATSFQPVCTENSTVTYFSPCYAGCTRKTSINDVELYESCTCSSDYEMNRWSSIHATEGSCSAASCFKMLIIFQVLSVSAAGIYGMTTIGKIIITLRSVLPQDKTLALAMEVMFVGLFAYIPTHLAYDVVTRTTCIFWSPGYSRCLLRETPKHGDLLNMLSAGLIIIGIIFDVLVFVYAKGLNIYNCKVTDVNYTPSLYAPVSQADQQPDSAHQQSTSGGSPGTTMTSPSPEALHHAQPTRPAPHPEIAVFRNPSSLTSSSAGEGSVAASPGVNYAQVVFPPDKRRTNDGNSPKRMVVRADVPLHHLSLQDVRSQLTNLKSFDRESTAGAETNLSLSPSPSTTAAEAAPLLKRAPPVPPKPTRPPPLSAKPVRPVDTDLDVERPLSPETDF